MVEQIESRYPIRWALAFMLALPVFAATSVDPAAEFTARIRPVLVENCAACHNPAKANGPAPFLKATTITDLDSNRGLWRNVAAQLRNRAMPPVASKLTEEDRLHVSSWIESRLRQTACSAGDYAGSAITRRLNRREYRNTIRDLLGLDLEINTVLPADGTGGAGFDTNGETLYLPAVLTERYMEAAQMILDRVIVTPAFAHTFPASAPAAVPSYGENQYNLRLTYNLRDAAQLTLKIDGAEAGHFNTPRRRVTYGKELPGPLNGALQVTLSRGSHILTVESNPPLPADATLTVTQRDEPSSPERRSLHYRLFGIEPGEQPLNPRRAARQILEHFLPKAFRRPVDPGEVDRFLALYDRAAERGDPFEERVKLALKAVLVWPNFLFRVERKPTEPGIHPLSSYELATRLSYFLWSTAPDDTLTALAAQGTLSDPKVLTAQVDRMLDDPRSRAFLTSFTGQWLGTQDVGGRVVPLLTELQSFYTPETAADLRAEPVLLLGRIVDENRSLLELLTADYTYMTARLAKFYGLEKELPGLTDEFRLVHWPDNRRAGILGLGAVLALTSRYKETSPVLRGAWVLETMLGTPVPPPPADVPPLKTDAELGHKLTMRERLATHRSNPACSACHRMMDPIGFGLESFDWMGRWRDVEENGKPIDASGVLPSGEKFNGVVELRKALLGQKDEFIGNLSAKALGYALGRSLQDGDGCTVRRIADALAKDDYRARTLIHEIVLSVPFRNTQGGLVRADPIMTQRSLDISTLNATKQDAASHNNGIKPANRIRPQAK
jgi:mono/diheme cytochrome c family protein